MGVLLRSKTTRHRGATAYPCPITMKRALLLLLSVAWLIPEAKTAPLTIRTPMTPPAWALMERELLKANAEACREFFKRYFDERGFLLLDLLLELSSFRQELWLGNEIVRLVGVIQ